MFVKNHRALLLRFFTSCIKKFSNKQTISLASVLQSSIFMNKPLVYLCFLILATTVFCDLTYASTSSFEQPSKQPNSITTLESNFSTKSSSELNNLNSSLQQKYLNSQVLIVTGSLITAIGIGIVAGGILNSVASDTSGDNLGESLGKAEELAIFISVGSVVATGGLLLLTVGTIKNRRIRKQLNQQSLTRKFQFNSIGLVSQRQQFQCTLGFSF